MPVVILENDGDDGDSNPSCNNFGTHWNCRHLSSVRVFIYCYVHRPLTKQKRVIHTLQLALPGVTQHVCRAHRAASFTYCPAPR